MVKHRLPLHKWKVGCLRSRIFFCLIQRRAGHRPLFSGGFRGEAYGYGLTVWGGNRNPLDLCLGGGFGSDLTKLLFKPLFFRNLALQTQFGYPMPKWFLGMGSFRRGWYWKGHRQISPWALRFSVCKTAVKFVHQRRVLDCSSPIEWPGRWWLDCSDQTNDKNMKLRH